MLLFLLSEIACCINIDFYDTKDGFFLKSTYHKFKASEPTIVKEALILTHPAEVYKLRASYGPIEKYEVSKIFQKSCSRSSFLPSNLLFSKLIIYNFSGNLNTLSLRHNLCLQNFDQFVFHIELQYKPLLKRNH